MDSLVGWSIVDTMLGTVDNRGLKGNRLEVRELCLIPKSKPRCVESI